MKQKLFEIFRLVSQFCRNHLKLLIAAFTALLVLLMAVIFVCNRLVNSNAKYIMGADNKKHVHIGMVLGAGITKDGKPFKELQARLDSAADALNEGRVDKLILSGDNRFHNYNEPDAMVDYLVHVRHIAADKLQPDYAGRSTYESCDRASKIFGAHELIIFSAGSHLPRAIYLCRHFGIAAYGISSGVEANNSRRREWLARVKAVFNIYVLGENTVPGSAITL